MGRGTAQGRLPARSSITTGGFSIWTLTHSAIIRDLASLATAIVILAGGTNNVLSWGVSHIMGGGSTVTAGGSPIGGFFYPDPSYNQS